MFYFYLVILNISLNVDFTRIKLAEGPTTIVYISIDHISKKKSERQANCTSKVTNGGRSYNNKAFKICSTSETVIVS